MNIVDEDQKKALQSYDPQAPVTRKGVLRSLRTGRPIEIREDDLVGSLMSILNAFVNQDPLEKHQNLNQFYSP